MKMLIGFLLALSLPALGVHTFPQAGNEADFFKSGERDISRVKVRNIKIALIKGRGVSFGSHRSRLYRELKQAMLTDSEAPIQWLLMELDTGRMLDRSSDINRQFYGASVSKIMVGGAMLSHLDGEVSPDQLQPLADMIVVSDNQAWQVVQDIAGDGNVMTGRRKVDEFTKSLGLKQTRGYRGWLDGKHGNEINVYETALYIQSIYQDRFPGSELLWKLLFAIRTGATKAKKYWPKNLYIAGKTGTYSGPTWDPRTGSDRNPDGSKYKVQVAHHSLVFEVDGTAYTMVIFTNRGQNEDVALMAGGLLREHFPDLF